MTTTQHTPGPWKLAENPIGWQPLISAEVADSIGPIWHVGIANARGRSHEEAKANARLIAAAPLMLSALRTALQAMGDTYDARDSDDDGESFRDIITAAIAAATGRDVQG